MKQIGNVLILGDSYSTFEGQIPEGFASWYFYQIQTDTDVDQPEQTWWKQVLANTQSHLVRNCSWSGTTVCHTGYEGDCSNKSFVTRFENLVKDGFFEKNRVDTLFLFGGTNDSWANAPLGEEMLEGWTREDLFCVLPAIGYLLARMKETLPNTRIITIINTELKPEIGEAMQHACAALGLEWVELQDIAKQSGHPNQMGMRQIGAQVLNSL